MTALPQKLRTPSPFYMWHLYRILLIDLDLGVRVGLGGSGEGPLLI